MLKKFILLDLYILSLLNTELRKNLSHFWIHLALQGQGPSSFIDLQVSREHGGSNGTMKHLQSNVELFINTNSVRKLRSIGRFSSILHCSYFPA